MGRNAPYLTFKRMGLPVYDFSSGFCLDRAFINSVELEKVRVALLEAYGESSVKFQIEGLLELMKSKKVKFSAGRLRSPSNF